MVTTGDKTGDPMRMALRGTLLLMVAGIVVACRPDPSSARTASEFCRAALAGDGSWTIAAKMGDDQSGALALVSGARVAGCLFIERDMLGVRHGESQWAEAPTSSPQSLTYSVELPADEASSDSRATLMTGRMPDGATRVRVLMADGGKSEATIGGGLWLAWLEPPAEPVGIEAVDASGAVVGRIADPDGLGRPAGGPSSSPR